MPALTDLGQRPKRAFGLRVVRIHGESVANSILTLCAATLRKVVGPVKDLSEASMEARAAVAAAAVEDLSEEEGQGEVANDGDNE